MRHIACLFAVFFSTLLVGQHAGGWSRVKVHVPVAHGGMRQLASLGLAVDHPVEIGPHHVVADLGHDEIAIALAHGYAVDTVIADVVDHYKRHRVSVEERAVGFQCDGPRLFNDPTHFGLGSMAGFFTYEEYEAQLQAMVAEYPNIVSAITSIGTTIEGRPIHMVRISDSPGVDETEPEILYTAVHHAREPGSLSQLLFYMWHLLENYGTDAEVTYLVDHREMYFVPCINPDGYIYNQTIEPDGGGMWRKNRRDNGDGTFGVDLNRNYGWLWGFNDEGSSPDPASAVYRGSAPFSEPETQAIRDLCEAHEFRLALNYHTQGNMVIHPWGTGQGLLTPDSLLFEAEADLLTRNSPHHAGTCDQVLFYNVNGGSDDWMYGEQAAKPKIQAMTPEVGRGDEGFWPPSDRILPICRENVDQNLLLAHLGGAYARTLDLSPPVFSTFNAYAPFELERVGFDAADLTVSIEPLQNVASTGAPLLFSGLDLLERRVDSIAMVLESGLAQGAPVSYVIAVDNGLFTVRDTIRRSYDTPVVVFSDSGNNTDQWDTFDWGVTTEEFFSPPSALTDSPNGPYEAFIPTELITAEPIDLSDATSATLRFMAKWSVTRFLDHVDVRASSDGSNWTSLCGNYTLPASIFQMPDREQVFEGVQRDWVREEMDLSAFAGGPAWLRFGLSSLVEFPSDGFYVDDIEVLATGDLASAVPVGNSATLGLLLRPNPVHQDLWVRVPDLPGGTLHVSITDVQGRLCSTTSAAAGAVHRLDVSALAEGIYSLMATGAHGERHTGRFIVQR